MSKRPRPKSASAPAPRAQQTPPQANLASTLTAALTAEERPITGGPTVEPAARNIKGSVLSQAKRALERFIDAKGTVGRAVDEGTASLQIATNDMRDLSAEMQEIREDIRQTMASLDALCAVAQKKVAAWHEVAEAAAGHLRNSNAATYRRLHTLEQVLPALVDELEKAVPRG